MLKLSSHSFLKIFNATSSNKIKEVLYSEILFPDVNSDEMYNFSLPEIK